MVVTHDCVACKTVLVNRTNCHQNLVFRNKPYIILYIFMIARCSQASTMFTKQHDKIPNIHGTLLYLFKL